MMGTRNKKLSVNRTVDAEVFIPVLRIPQPNGDVLIRAGKPEILSSADEISPTQFARRVGLSHRRVLSLIEEGLITARPLSPAKNSRWRIPRAEVARYRNLEKQP